MRQVNGVGNVLTKDRPVDVAQSTLFEIHLCGSVLNIVKFALRDHDKIFQRDNMDFGQNTHSAYTDQKQQISGTTDLYKTG